MPQCQKLDALLLIIYSVLNKTVATRSEPIHGVLGGDAGQGGGDGRLKFLPGARLRTSQALFDLAPHLFNRVQVRRVGWQEPDRCPGLLNQSQGGVVLVGREVVHDDHVTRSQRRTQHFPHIALEHFRVRSPFNRHAGGRTIQPDGGQHRGGLPVAAGRAGVNPVAA